MLLSSILFNFTRSFEEEGEETLERGEAPLLPTLPLPLLREGGQGDRLPNNLSLQVQRQ